MPHSLQVLLPIQSRTFPPRNVGFIFSSARRIAGGVTRVVLRSCVVFVLGASFAASSFCQVGSAPRSGASATPDARSARWIGRYEPLSRACANDLMIVEASAFTWGDCKATRTSLISVSDTVLAFSVDPGGKCGWAGWVVELSVPSIGSNAVSVNAYRSPHEYQARQSTAFCAYGKNP